MACNKFKNSNWQNIEYVRKLAYAVSLEQKSDVTIYKTYERGLGDVYCFDIFKKGFEPETTVEIIRFREPKSRVILQDDVNEGLQPIAPRKAKKVESGKSRSTGK